MGAIDFLVSSDLSKLRQMLLLISVTLQTLPMLKKKKKKTSGWNFQIIWNFALSQP